MLVKNVISKLERAGFSVMEERQGCFRASKVGQSDYVHFLRNGGFSEDCICLSVVSRNDKSDISTDYFPQLWCDSVAQAIKYCRN